MKTVVVCTKHRGVFLGELKEDGGKHYVVLKNAQMCNFWSKETHGVLGLAERGPQEGSRIGPVVAEIKLYDITAVIEASEKAVEVWRTQPWF